MAESRGSLLAKSVQKHAGRAKEKVSDVHRMRTLLGYVRDLKRALPIGVPSALPTRAPRKGTRPWLHPRRF